MVLYIFLTVLLLASMITIVIKFGSEPVDLADSRTRDVVKGDRYQKLKRKRVARKERLENKKISISKRVQVTPKGLIVIDVISDRIKRLDSTDDKINLLEPLWDVDDPALPQLVLELLDDKSKEVRLEAMELLNTKEKGDILKCIEKALDDPEEEVRVLAVTLLNDSSSNGAEKLLVKGIDDGSEEVRSATFDVLESKPAKMQEDIYKQSISSPYADVKELTIELVMDIPSHTSVNILFRALNDSDKDIKELTNSKLDFIFSREFKNSNEALIWWEKNKKNYDEELFENSPSPQNL